MIRVPEIHKWIPKCANRNLGGIPPNRSLPSNSGQRYCTVNWSSNLWPTELIRDHMWNNLFSGQTRNGTFWRKNIQKVALVCTGRFRNHRLLREPKHLISTCWMIDGNTPLTIMRGCCWADSTEHFRHSNCFISGWICSGFPEFDPNKITGEVLPNETTVWNRDVWGVLFLG